MERTTRGHIVNYNRDIAEALIESAFTRSDHSACKRTAHYEAECRRLAARAGHHKRRACQWKTLSIALWLILAAMVVFRYV